MNKILTKTTILGILGLAAAASAPALNAQSLFSNTNQISGTFSSLNNEVGDEIVLQDNGTGSTITNFTFDFYTANLSATASVTVYFYANTGVASSSGPLTPNTTPIWSDTFPLAPYALTNVTGGTVITEIEGNDLPVGGVEVPSDFTWAIEFDNATVDGSSDAGPLLSTVAPNTGYDYTDYWLNTGTSSSPNWVLATNTSPINFVADFEGTPNPPAPTPEPSSMALMGLGIAGLAGFFKRAAKRS